jgi:hypothetical protein
MSGNKYINQIVDFVTLKPLRKVKKKLKEVAQKTEMVNKDVKTLLNAVKNDRTVDQIK